MENYKEKSYWMTTRDYKPNDSLKGPVDADVAVIGGGFTGLSTSYHLKKEEPGKSIALIEAEVIGFGASGRNAGFSMTKFGLIHSITAFRFGNAKTIEAHEYNCRAVDLLQELIKKLKLDCDYEHTGFLMVATCKKQQERMEHEFEFVTKKLGIKEIDWIGENELRARVNSPMYMGGAWWEPRTGILNPAKLAWSWKSVIERLGVKVYENSPVTEILRDGRRYLIKTPEGQVRARKIVLATNAWSHHFSQTRRKQVPVWTYIVLTEPLKQKHLREIGWRGREGIEDFRDLVHYYRLTADNRIVLGGRDVGLLYGYDMPAQKDIDEHVFESLKSDMVEMFPQLSGVTFTHQWGGPVSVPMDIAPAMGYAGSKDIVYSLGCCGHAVSMTHLNGRTLTDLLLEKKTDLTEAFFVNRTTFPWPPEPFRNVIARAIRGILRWDDQKWDRFSARF